ncbi:flagellar basal body rod C-terminal domain-containing protein [Oleidesulfovibrio sp.]|uniref:flagellar basal body rod C-terminal domain-containing protein n=1 Tax=Oleidesulfovibrio sp. TaxID=2909707 RepID=UPI003A8691FD
MRIESNLQALNAFSVRQAVTANNIANVNTDNFQPSRTVLETGPEGEGVRVADIRRQQESEAMRRLQQERIQTADMQHADELRNASETDIARETVNMIENQRAYEANAAAIRAQDEMIGTFIDEMI